jgi:hypothetical protein
MPKRLKKIIPNRPQFFLNRRPIEKAKGSIKSNNSKKTIMTSNGNGVMLLSFSINMSWIVFLLFVININTENRIEAQEITEITCDFSGSACWNVFVFNYLAS